MRIAALRTEEGQRAEPSFLALEVPGPFRAANMFATRARDAAAAVSDALPELELEARIGVMRRRLRRDADRLHVQARYERE